VRPLGVSCVNDERTVPPHKIVPDHLRPVLELFDDERRSLFLAGVQGEVLPAVTRSHGVAGGWHQISYSSLASADADQIIAEQVEHYRRLGGGLEWAAYAHDAPPDLLDRLARHGFEIGPREAVVVLDCQHTPAWLSEPGPYRVEPVRTSEDLAVFAETAEQIFGRDQTPVVRELEARLAEGSREHIAYLVYAEPGVVASVARLYTHPSGQFAGLYGGGTLAAHRGRGLYRAGVRRRALDAIALGARYLRVDALPTSQPILQRLGFEVLTYVWPCVLIE
jgi:hypothetical protein